MSEALSTAAYVTEAPRIDPTALWTGCIGTKKATDAEHVQGEQSTPSAPTAGRQHKGGKVAVGGQYCACLYARVSVRAHNGARVCVVIRAQLRGLAR